jgi:hypothetical protein
VATSPGAEARFVRGRHLAEVVKRSQWSAYRRDPNIIGAAFGRRIVRGEFTDEPALVIYVARKVPAAFLPPTRLLPRRMYVGGDWIEVDVFETGPIYPQAFTTRDRPAPSGISIGRGAASPVDAGTLGCLVIDNTDGRLCILSNNHVLANENAAPIGDVIVQQGTIDGGTSPADDIATLKRFVMINAAGNTVDGAIAQVTKVGDVVDQMRNNLMPVPTPNHPAVGLLFAGGCNRTIMNPIRDVMAQLNITMPAGPGAITGPDIGMNVEKVGRTTEYTTSTITEIDLTVTLPYDFGSATFDHQIATAWLSEPGDSGSVVCQGGVGGNEDRCGGGCLSIATAQQILGTDLSVDAAVEKEFRERYLSQTRIGRYVIDLFFRNESRLVERARSLSISDSDRAFARYLYDKHIQEGRMALIQPNRTDLRVTEDHLRDAREALGRAKQYMNADEVEASEALFQLAYQAQGKTGQEILAMLNDEGLFEQVRQILSRVSFLEQPNR